MAKTAKSQSKTARAKTAKSQSKKTTMAKTAKSQAKTAMAKTAKSQTIRSKNIEAFAGALRLRKRKKASRKFPGFVSNQET